jgi:predicted acetyltransferase
MNIVNAKHHPNLHDWLRTEYESYLTELVSFGAELTREPGGFWQPDYFSYWLGEPMCHPLVVPEIGFAMVGDREFEYRNHDTEFVLCEFYVVPEARGRGLGRELARHVIAKWPGTWELSVLKRNAPALRFWRALLPDAEEHAREEFVDFVFASR